MLSDVAVRRPFDPAVVIQTDCMITTYQNVHYFMITTHQNFHYFMTTILTRTSTTSTS